MDDLSEKLDRLLSSPDGMARIADMMAAFGADAPSPAAPVPAPENDDGLDMGMLLKLLPLLEQFKGPDDNTALLKALRPHLKEERQRRLDDAGQLLKMARLLPLLGQLGNKGDDDT